jgi:hypothetical protein
MEQAAMNDFRRENGHGVRWQHAAKVLLALAALMSAETPAADQALRAFEGYTRDAGERGSATLQQLKEQRTTANDVASKPRANSVVASTTLSDQWIYDADAELYDDLDDDGYYRFLSVRLDADTYLVESWVYAMLYLSADGEVWDHYYTTNDFLIGGTVADDEYFVETELLEGYPPGLYDVLIELYDADFASFADEFGPNQSSALSLLPIEDASFDRPPVQIAISSEHGGGGSMSWAVLVLLLTLILVGQLRARATARRHQLVKLPSRVLPQDKPPSRQHPSAAQPYRDRRGSSDR